MKASSTRVGSRVPKKVDRNHRPNTICNSVIESRLSITELQMVFGLWFLSTFFGTLLPTRVLLAFIGPKGSGKSHTLRKVGMLLFGSRFEVKSLPDKEDSIDAITTNT